jgi:GNAT superfamily N-acetyltransferase
MVNSLPKSWGSFASLCAGFYAAATQADLRVCDDWFGALSRERSAEVNVGGLHSQASSMAASELVQFFGPGQPGLVFTSEHVAPESRLVLLEAGFEAAETAEPPMRCRSRPEVAESEFRISHCKTDDDFAIALRLTSEAHTVDVELLVASIGAAARSGAAEVSLALHDGEPVSAVWICRSGSSLGVMEMMTPKQHQGRGAGRAVLTAALAAAWSTETSQALLLSTPAGRHLYESVGFESVDESITFYRGLEESVLGAIGQIR